MRPGPHTPNMAVASFHKANLPLKVVDFLTSHQAAVTVVMQQHATNQNDKDKAAANKSFSYTFLWIILRRKNGDS